MNARLSGAERVSMTLRALYQSYGYRQYKVSKFEEYDLYAQNRNFLAGERILTFSDINGRLMALKPDITLSIIKNTRDDRRMRKLWYTENVYRVPSHAYGFQEILQTGLECIGDVDLYAMGEVLMLAAESLLSISGDYVLNISNLNILTGVFAAAGLDAALSGELLSAVGAKNRHLLRELCARGGISPEYTALLETFCLLAGDAKPTLETLLSLPLPAESLSAARELERLCDILAVFGDYRVNLDLSIINDTDYYTGLIFRGFINGVAASVLSGGRYDQLLDRMGKTGGAVGFAVYLSELERFLGETRQYDVDTLLTYEPGSDPLAVAKRAKALVAAGHTVRAQQTGDAAITYREKITPDGKEAN